MNIIIIQIHLLQINLYKKDTEVCLNPESISVLIRCHMYVSSLNLVYIAQRIGKCFLIEEGNIFLDLCLGIASLGDNEIKKSFRF